MAPDPRDRESLIEPEGVNAGSRRTEEEPRAERDGTGPGDGRDGGRPSAAGEQARPEQAVQPEHTTMVGAPGTEDSDPSQAQGEPGQDTGSQA